VSFLLFYGETDNQYYLFVSKTVGLMDIGHHFESFTVGNRDLVDRGFKQVSLPDDFAQKY
jgi:hypothetical protein